MWREFWAEVSQPSNSVETVYHWSLIATGHVFIGVVLATILPVAPWVIGLSYFVLKEVKDMVKGGRIGDSIIDTLFVILGASMFFIPAAFCIIIGIQFYKQVRTL